MAHSNCEECNDNYARCITQTDEFQRAAVDGDVVRFYEELPEVPKTYEQQTNYINILQSNSKIASYTLRANSQFQQSHNNCQEELKQVLDKQSKNEIGKKEWYEKKRGDLYIFRSIQDSIPFGDPAKNIANQGQALAQKGILLLEQFQKHKKECEEFDKKLGESESNKMNADSTMMSDFIQMINIMYTEVTAPVEEATLKEKCNRFNKAITKAKQVKNNRAFLQKEAEDSVKNEEEKEQDTRMYGVTQRSFLQARKSPGRKRLPCSTFPPFQRPVGEKSRLARYGKF